MDSDNESTPPLDLGFVREFCELAEAHDLVTLDVSYKDFHVKVSRAQEILPPPTPVWPVAPRTAEAAASSTVEMPPSGVLVVTAPLAGVFYRAPSPEAPPFVVEGTSVSHGQVLCIIEAMKMMNEIPSESAGQVVRILPANGQVVEAGQEIFHLKPLATA